MSELAPVGLTCPLKAQQIRDVIEWMSVDTVPRWQPKDGKTYCNVYASDLCHQLGIYLPRQWWRDPATVTRDTPLIYGETTRELSANSLVGWMRARGEEFGWKIKDDPAPMFPDSLGLVIAKARSGHGHVQVLYHDAKGMLCATQAGSTNFKKEPPYSTGFWRSSRYVDCVWAVAHHGGGRLNA